ncbi:MFS transporter [Fructobacillus sp. CRL 2054]|uniref:MFS transporter n=1 Tax=Fructobacillus sp. CRL 2054 TaxID=2763007 RepID=UPI002377DA71|nr:MFS transporter [Fructobacillus sp. CRL 2054]MDD9138902.1 MFS transporter [Fructobacillus sp. CRL 2054]
MQTIGTYLKNRGYQSLFFSNLAETLGSSLFNIVLVIYAGMMPSHSQQGWALTAVGIANFVPGIYQMLTGYLADRQKSPLKMSRNMKMIQAACYLVLACFINQPFTWLIFSILLLINIFSDSIGNFSTSLLLPTMRDLVSDEDRERVTGFSSGILQSISLAGQFIGSTLIVVFTYNYQIFSLANAALFLLSAIFLFRAARYITGTVKGEIAADEEQERVNQHFFKSLKLAISEVLSVPMLGRYISIYTIAGLVGAAFGEVAILAFLRTPSLQIISFGISVATMQTVFAVGSILGSIVPIPFLEKRSLATVLLLQISFVFLLVLAFLTACPFYIGFSVMFFTALVQGKVQPKFSAWVMNHTANKNLAFAMSIISTATTITLPLGQLIFMTIANVFSITISFACMAVYILCLLGYIFFVRVKEQKQQLL